jgi:hypothetical protein
LISDKMRSFETLTGKMVTQQNDGCATLAVSRSTCSSRGDFRADDLDADPRSHYPDRWVALVDMDWNEDAGEFTVARVAGHGSTRLAPFDPMRAAGLNYETVGHFYTGRVRAYTIDFVR